MADTYTSTLGVILMGIGGDNNTWGTNLNNSVFQIFEDSIANTLTVAASGGQLGPSNTLDLSSTPPPAGPSAARYARLVFSGAITANQIVKVPNATKWWFVHNNTTGNFTVSMQTPSGSPVVRRTPPVLTALLSIACCQAAGSAVWQDGRAVDVGGPAVGVGVACDAAPRGSRALVHAIAVAMIVRTATTALTWTRTRSLTSAFPKSLLRHTIMSLHRIWYAPSRFAGRLPSWCDILCGCPQTGHLLGL